MKLSISSVCSAFATICVGTKVLDPEAVLSAINSAIEGYDWDRPLNEGEVRGQAFLSLPLLTNAVRTGVGRRTTNPEDFRAREHRGRVNLYLDPSLAAPLEGLAAIVYTTEAYLADPEVTDEEAQRIKNEGADYVLVALLAFAGPKAPVDEVRFVSNLAGGNRAYDDLSIERAKEMASEVKEYHDAWCVVAD